MDQYVLEIIDKESGAVTTGRLVYADPETPMDVVGISAFIHFLRKSKHRDWTALVKQVGVNPNTEPEKFCKVYSRKYKTTYRLVYIPTGGIPIDLTDDEEE